MSLLEEYKEKIVPKLIQDLGLSNKMAAPAVTKIVVNMGIGDIKESREEQERAISEFAALAGQKPSVRLAKRAVASFGVRVGQPVGLMATLRGVRMYNFLEKLISIVLPRLRDFRGVPSTSFDREGNYTLGVSEHTVFPEIDLGKITRVRGLEITIVTSTRDVENSKKLLETLGMPFEKGEASERSESKDG